MALERYEKLQGVGYKLVDNAIKRYIELEKLFIERRKKV